VRDEGVQLVHRVFVLVAHARQADAHPAQGMRMSIKGPGAGLSVRNDYSPDPNPEPSQMRLKRCKETGFRAALYGTKGPDPAPEPTLKVG
jgi:hypothetical protein